MARREANEQALGLSLAREILASSTPWTGPRANEYVNRLGQNLARASGSDRVFIFRVLSSPDVNAEALPGGIIFVNSAVIGLAENEGELASVLAHEIAHVNLGHTGHMAGRAGVWKLAAMVPMAVVGGPLGAAITYGALAADPAVMARSSRSAERAADRLAALYLARAGYDPECAARMFARLQADQARRGGAPGGLLSTHPSPAKRREAIEKVLPTIPPPAVTPSDTTEFQAIHKEIRDYDNVYSGRAGITPQGDPRPSALARRTSSTP